MNPNVRHHFRVRTRSVVTSRYNLNITTTKIPFNQEFQYQFTPEELRVLKECNKESFYTRCLPLGTGLGGLAYFAVQSG